MLEIVKSLNPCSTGITFLTAAKREAKAKAASLS